MELEDEDAAVLANLVDVVLSAPISLANHSRQLLVQMRDSVREQIPLAVPAKVGAVVRTDRGVFVRTDLDNPSTKEWRQPEPDGLWWDTEGIGRIVAVLSEGVEL
jgi:hypothetical protein